MGLLTKKDPCAICGGKVSGLFPYKIEGHLICNECHGQVDLPDEMENRMTLEDFKAYRQFREENKLLRDRFQISQQVDFGWLDTKFLFDFPHRLLCMDKNLNRTIFEGKQITSFVIREDDAPLFEGSAAGLRRYTSTVPDRAMAMTTQIELYHLRLQMERARREDKKQPEIRFDIPEPFNAFNVEIRFAHPYWSFFTADMSGPTFDNTYPDVNDYLREYQESATTIEQLAEALMEVAFPGAAVQAAGSPVTAARAGTEPTSSAPVDTVTELQRYKALLEQGIITEEEFTAKKRQLLGI